MNERLEITRVAEFRNAFVAELSGGIKQKFSLIGTLFHHPKVLFLYKPTTGIDLISRRDL